MLDQTITSAEVSRVVKSIENNKAAGTDGIVGELIKYGVNPMCEMFLILFNSVWNNENVAILVSLSLGTHQSSYNS